MRASNEVDTLISDIGARLVRDETYLAQPWEGIALAVGVDGAADGATVRMHGYCYLGGGGIVAATPGAGAAAWFLELRERMAAAEARPWQACLVQVRREGAKLSFLFEHDDPRRWAVTPFNWRERREELRPG